MLKSLVLSSLALFTSASFAAGEWSTFKCVSQTNSGRVLTIEGCIGEGPELVPCQNEDFEFVTITRETNVSRMTPDMVETVKVPGRLFELTWEEESFSISIDDRGVGKMDLQFVAGLSANEPQKWDLDIQGLKHNFRAVGCQFGSN